MRQTSTYGRRALVAVAGLLLLAATQAACTPAKPVMAVTAPEDVLRLTTRLVFSTYENTPTEPRAVTLTNTSGSTAIDVTGLVLGGASPGQFALADGQATSFTIAPGGSATVAARFVPTSFGNKFATLTIQSNASVPSYVVNLRGVAARGTLGNTEPQLAQLMQLFGYTTDIGFTTPTQQATRQPYGDEVIAPYFVRADASKPVSLVPIARYVAAVLGQPDSGRTAKASPGRTALYRFPPDEFADDTPGDGEDDSIYVENQKTFPGISSGTFTFSPTGAFGLYGNFINYSDDRYNADELGTVFHNIRAYPAKGPGGVVIPDTWILGLDVNTNPPSKNFDYQDQVMLLTNARPDVTPGPQAGAATTLSFDAPVPGTVADEDGEGTGFTSVQPNKDGSQYKPQLIDVSGGALRITSTVRKNSGTENLQDNALQLDVDATRSDLFVQGRVVGPLSDLTAGFQQKAVWFGPDQNNYLKVEAEHRTDDPGVWLTAFREQGGSTATIARVPVPNPGSVATVDLGVSTDYEGATLQAWYRIDDGAWTALGTPFAPTTVINWFSPQAKAGVLVSHTGSTTPIVGVYDSFSVTTAVPTP